MRAVQKLGMFVVAMALVGTVGPGSSAGPEQEKREHAANGRSEEHTSELQSR